VSIKRNESATAMRKSGKGVIMQKMLANSAGLMITNTSVQRLILAAYDLQDDRVSGGPDWPELFNIDAKMDSTTAAKLHQLPSNQADFARRRMLQALLADRFKGSTLEFIARPKNFPCTCLSSPKVDPGCAKPRPVTLTRTESKPGRTPGRAGHHGRRAAGSRAYHIDSSGGAHLIFGAKIVVASGSHGSRHDRAKREL